MARLAGLRQRLGRPGVNGGTTPHVFPYRAQVSYLLPVALVVLTYAMARPAAVDDAYITFRYVDRLIRGDGLVFNPGEHVEGISNVLWAMLLVVPHALGISIVCAASVLGLISAAAMAVMTGRLGCRLGLAPGVALAMACGIALSTQVVAASTMGLEGGLYGALLLATLLVAGARKPRPILLGMTVIALGSTRPEGLVVGAGIGLLLAAYGRGATWQRFAAPVACLLAIGVIETARLAWFGTLLPNSVLAKRDVGYSPLDSLRTHLPQGARYLLESFGYGSIVLGIVALLATATALIALWSDGHLARPQFLPAAISATVAIGLAVPLFVGGDWMPYARLLTPYFPLVFLLGGLALRASLNATFGRRPWVGAAIGILPLVLVISSSYPSDLRDNSSDEPYDEVGRALQRIRPDGPVATTVLGRAGFYAPDVRFHDMLGLIDPIVAATPGRGGPYGKYNLEYSMSLGAPVIIVNSPIDGRDVLVAATAAGTTLVGVAGAHLTSKRIFILAEAGFGDRLVAALQPAFPGTHVVAPEDAVADWISRYPEG